MANPNWCRWIHASVAKYLKDISTVNSLASLVEELEDRTTEFSESPDRVEIRMNGPYTTNPSSSYYIARIAINVLITSNAGGKTKNVYRMDEIAGIFHEALHLPIPVFKLGTDPLASGYQLGCLMPLDDKQGVKVFHFGQIDPTDQVRQSMVSAAYQIELDE